MLKTLKLEKVIPNPDQPRKLFDQGALEQLASSIQERGLLQPITVRPVFVDENGEFESASKGKPPKGQTRKYMIVMGERRWRAHCILQDRGLIDSIRCEVREMEQDDMEIDAILENLQRVDVTSLEEGVAMQRLVDSGYKPAQIAKLVGYKSAGPVNDRLRLLGVSEVYRGLFMSRQINESALWALSHLEGERLQDQLFEMIKKGAVTTHEDMMIAMRQIKEKDEAPEMFAAPTTAPSAAEQKAASAFASRIERVTALLGACDMDNEIVAVKKVRPHEVQKTIATLALMKTEIGRIEKAFKAAQVQLEMTEAA